MTKPRPQLKGGLSCTDHGPSVYIHKVPFNYPALTLLGSWLANHGRDCKAWSSTIRNIPAIQFG